MGKEIETRVKSLEAKFAMVAGEVHALKVIVGSFIAISPLCQEMLKSFDAVEDVVESRVLPAGVPEEFLEGSRQMLSDVRRALESAQERQTPPNPL